MIIVTTEGVREAYNQILRSEEQVRLRQLKRDSRELDTQVWIVHDKDTGEAIAVGDTKTMACKRAHAVIIFPEVKARKHSWLDLEKYSLKEYTIK